MNPPDLYAAMSEIRDLIAAAGVRAVLDLRDVNPPAVLVQTPVLRPRFSKYCWDADWSAVLVAVNIGPEPSAKELSALLPTVIDALAASGRLVVAATPVTVSMPSGDPSGPLPAYSLIWSDTL